jgi:SAM-dependent methyltransferase
MLDCAATRGDAVNVQWRQADAMQLPFDDATFDAVVCQFGVMFFPDRVKAHEEARRVLKPGGTFFFNAWDRIEENEFADAVTTTLQALFPRDPPRFLARTPHGYHDISQIAADLEAAGFRAGAYITTVSARSRAGTCRDPAVAFCHGTPLRTEIETRDPDALGEATEMAAEAIARRFGRGPVEGKIQAHVVTVTTS